MTTSSAAVETPAFDAGEQFVDLLEESLGGADSFEGAVLSGIVVAVEGDVAVVDVGLKSEGRLPLKEFGPEAAASCGRATRSTFTANATRTATD